MQNDSSVNSVQASILRTLQHQEQCRFADLNVNRVPSDQFSYHLRQLVKYGLVAKSEDGVYRLSSQGRTRTMMLHDNKDGFIQQGFLAVLLVLTRETNGVTEYLAEERQISPYKGSIAPPAGKMLFGEDVLETAQRTLKENTGLTCSLELKGLHHYKDYMGSELMQDKYFFVCVGQNPTGTLVQPAKRRVFWSSLNKLMESKKLIHGFNASIEIASNPAFQFHEATYDVDSY